VCALYTGVVSILGSINPAPEFTLERHEIAQVICQVRFSPVLRLRNESEVVPFQEAIRDRYPDFEAQQAMNILLTPQGLGQQDQPGQLWRFSNQDDGFIVVLGTDFVALETSRYVHIDDLCERLLQVLQLVGEHYKPAKTKRAGLRFINEIRFDENSLPGAMLDAFNPLLLGVAGASEFAEVAQLSRAIVQLETDESAVAVRHGLHPEGGTTAAETAHNRADGRPFYLLDIDAYSEAELDFSPDGAAERIRLFNDQIRTFFAWAVKEEFRRERLGQKELGS
jgi:uncharacterized protein (TIGR04255 family)